MNGSYLEKCLYIVNKHYINEVNYIKFIDIGKKLNAISRIRVKSGRYLERRYILRNIIR